MVRRWQDILMVECCRAITAGGGEIRIQFCPRSGDKLRPIVKTYLDNQTICEEVEVGEED